MPLTQFPILPNQQKPQGSRQYDAEKHKGGADTHSLDVSRSLGTWVYSCAEDGTALADDVDHDEAGAAAGVAALVVCV